MTMRFHATHTTSRRAFAAFSLVEILVVLVLLAGLVALVVHLAKAGDLKRQETHATQVVLRQALSEYHSIHDYYPPSAPSLAQKPATITVPASLSPPAALIYVHSNQLVGALDDDIDVRRYLLQLPPSALRRGSGGNPGEVLDAYGNPMDYLDTGAVGGTPVIISGGPDGFIGGANAKDDIRSDEK